MWQQLGMAGLQAYQDQRNKQQALASGVINEKYSGYTGRHGDFSAQGTGGGFSTLMKGYGAGLQQDKADALAERDAQWAAEDRKLWQDGIKAQTARATGGSPAGARVASVGTGPGRGASAMDAVSTAQAGPASQAQVPAIFSPEVPLMLQGRNPAGTNAFMDALGIPAAAEQAPIMAQARSAPAGNPWLEMSQRPLLPMEAQAPQAPAVDPTAALRKGMWEALPESMPIKHGWGEEPTEIPAGSIHPWIKRTFLGPEQSTEQMSYQPMKFPWKGGY